jgi:hypothetical protein
MVAEVLRETPDTATLPNWSILKHCLETGMKRRHTRLGRPCATEAGLMPRARELGSRSSEVWPRLQLQSRLPSYGSDESAQAS